MERKKEIAGRSRFGFICMAVLLVFGFLADREAQAGTATLSWNANTEPDLAGYTVYYGTSVRVSTCAFGGYAGYTTKVNTGNTNYYVISGLTNNVTFYFSLTAYDTSANESCFSSQVQKFMSVDVTSPSAPGTVRDGTGATDISSTTSRTQLSANWTAAADGESGIASYQYAIGTSAGGTQTLTWTTLGNVLAVTRTGLSLAIGTTYYFSVRAVNGYGLTGAAANSNGQVVQSTATADTTPPSAPGVVRDGAVVGNDAAFTYSTTTLSANWTASTDSQSGISGYQYAIGTTAGGTQTRNWTSLGNVLTATRTGLSLSIGATYYFSVRAINGQGLTGSAANSNGQYVNTISTGDTTPPATITVVRDGTGASDDAYTTSTTELSANWDASTDAESGVVRYLYAIGTAAGGTSVINWKDNGLMTDVTETGLSLVVGTTYYFSVRAENGVGLPSVAANSDGQYIGQAAALQVSNIQKTNLTHNSITITWDTNIPATSKVEYGPSASYGELVQDTGLVTSHNISVTGLTPGTLYHFRVVSLDAYSNEVASADDTFTTTAANTGSLVRVYANPFSLSETSPVKFTLKGTQGGDVKIFTVSGKLVRALKGAAGAVGISWDGKNENNEKVSAGIYIYRIIETGGDTFTGKLAIVP